MMPNDVPPFCTEHYGAPPYDECECSEHRRIRELEAELAKAFRGKPSGKAADVPYDPMTEEDAELLRQGRSDLYRIDDWGRENLLWLFARAEKAEAESEGLKGRLSALQARVAELERQLDPKNWVDENGEPDGGEFAREREEC